MNKYKHHWPYSVRLTEKDVAALDSLSEILGEPKGALLRIAFQNLAHEHLGANHANPDCDRCINERFGTE